MTSYRKTQPSFRSIEQVADATAASLVRAAAAAAFGLFQDEHFRQLAGFEKLSLQEHDRIFNELVLAFIILIMLTMEAPDLRVEDDVRKYLSRLSSDIPKAHLDYLKSTGLEAVHLRDWKKLINMRFKEYARDRHGARAAAMQLESEEGALDEKKLAQIQLMVPVHAVAIGCHHHNCRGVTDGQDELFKYLLNSLARFYINYRMHLEGRPITPLMRASAALRRVFYGLRKGKKK